MSAVLAAKGELQVRGRTQLPPPPRSAPRLAVEEVLRRTSRSSPLTAQELALHTGFEVAAVRGALNNLVQQGLAVNVTPRELPARYCGRLPPLANKSAPPPARYQADGLYDSTELHPYTGRPGAMDAYALPSLVDGQRVPRRRPVLIDSIQELPG